MKNPEPHPEKKIDKTLEDTFPASDPPAGGSKTREERKRRDADENISAEEDD